MLQIRQILFLNCKLHLIFEYIHMHAIKIAYVCSNSYSIKIAPNWKLDSSLMLSPVTIIVFHHIIPEQPYPPPVLIHFHKQIKAECQWRYEPLLSIPASVRINK